MRFSIAITLGLHYLLCQNVSSLKYAILDNHQSSIDQANNILREFFFGFAKALFRHKDEYRHVTVIGASPDNLRHMQSIFENYPYTIYTDLEKCVHSKQSNAGNIFIIFIEDLGDEMAEKNLQILPTCSKNCKVLLIFEGSNIKKKVITSSLRLSLRGMARPASAHLDKDSLKFYRTAIGKKCDLRVRSFFVWRPGSKMNKINSLFRSEKLNMHGCPISVGTIPGESRMVIGGGHKGSETILDGTERNLVLLLAEVLNFTIAVKYPSSPKNRNESLEESLVREAAAGTVDLAIAHLAPIKREGERIEFSRSYSSECLTWAVPREIGPTDNLVWAEFPGKIWALVFVVFVVICIVGYAIHNIKFRGNRNQIRVGFIVDILEIFAVSLGKPLNHIPFSRSGRFLLIIYTFFSMVITTAYNTSLAVILTTEHSSPVINDVQGIIDANLKIGGPSYYFNVHKNQNTPNYLDKKILERFQPIDNVSELMDRLKSNSDFACLARRSSLIWEKRERVLARDLITFDTFNTCVTTYSTVMVLPKGSFLTKPINRIIRRAQESGLLKHWESADDSDDGIWERRNALRATEDRITQKFENIFTLYFYCLLVCLLVFFVELLTAKFKFRKIKHTIRHG